MVLLVWVWDICKLQNLTILILDFVPRDLEWQRTVCPGPGPLGTNFQTKILTLGVYRPLQPKPGIPHPITIQTMKFDRKKNRTIPMIFDLWMMLVLTMKEITMMMMIERQSNVPLSTLRANDCVTTFAVAPSRNNSSMTKDIDIHSKNKSYNSTDKPFCCWSS